MKVRSITVSGVMHRKPLLFPAVKLVFALTCVIHEQKESLKNLRGPLQVMEIRLYGYVTFKE